MNKAFVSASSLGLLLLSARQGWAQPPPLYPPPPLCAGAAAPSWTEEELDACLEAVEAHGERLREMQDVAQDRGAAQTVAALEEAILHTDRERDRLQGRRRSTPLFVVGIVLTAGGGVSLLPGALFLTVGGPNDRLAGALLLGGGLAGIIGGSAMIAHGGRRERPAPRAAFRPVVEVGPGSVGIRAAF